MTVNRFKGLLGKGEKVQIASEFTAGMEEYSRISPLPPAARPSGAGNAYWCHISRVSARWSGDVDIFLHE